MLQRFLLPAAATVLLAGPGGALAQSGEVLTGVDAFGGYDTNEPGVTRLLQPGDMPPPDETKASANPANPIARPDGAVPEVPDGFEVELVADGTGQPRAMAFAPNGDLFVAHSRANEVRVYSFDDEGNANESVFASEGLNRPYGLAFYPSGENPEWVYVGNSDGLVRFPYANGDVEASGGAEELVSGIPASGHWTRSIAFSEDGETLFYAVGSESNFSETSDETPPSDDWIAENPLGAMWGAEEGRAVVMAFDPDGSNQRIFATGIRNCSGLTIQPETGNLWCVTNERDGLGDNLPFDYAAHIEEGQFYGWPWYYIGSNEDPRLAGARPDLADQVDVPQVLFQSHSAPLNIAFQGDAWGEEYAGDAFVAMHGSWNRGTRTGYKVVQLHFEDGEATGEYTDFVTGFVTDEGDVWGRPVGVAVGPDGALYVSEDAGGSIWRVRASE